MISVDYERVFHRDRVTADVDYAVQVITIATGWQVFGGPSSTSSGFVASLN